VTWEGAQRGWGIGEYVLRHFQSSLCNLTWCFGSPPRIGNPVGPWGWLWFRTRIRRRRCRLRRGHWSRLPFLSRRSLFVCISPVVTSVIESEVVDRVAWFDRDSIDGNNPPELSSA
jgi:hypothetical protein